jgi:Putative MetA-pathway of phenol degradation
VIVDARRLRKPARKPEPGRSEQGACAASGIVLKLLQSRVILTVVALALAPASSPLAQELEPGAYTPVPVGINLVILSNTISHGDMAFDPSGPIEDASGTINATSLVYARSINLANRSGQVLAAVPYVIGHLEGRVAGQLDEADRSGQADPRFRVSINLKGAPAMDMKAFVANRTRTFVGASLTVAAPLGQYASRKLINIGSNRWAFKPEVGVQHRMGRWTLDVYGGVWLFTVNDEFYPAAGRRTQDPVVSSQFHLQYDFRPGWWLSGNVNFYAGGRTTLNGRENLDLQKNSRAGVTMAMPVGTRQGLRVAFSQGAITTIGADFTSLSVAFQHRW